MTVSMLIVGKWWSVVLLSTIGAGVTCYLLRQPVSDENPSVDSLPSKDQ